MSRPSERPTPSAILQSCASLRALSPEQRDALADASHIAYAERGETIWIEGSTVGYFAVIGTGFVKMVRTTSGGQEVAAELIGPGQVMGLLALIRGGPCPLTARAVCGTWLLKVPRREFMSAYSESLGLRDSVLELTTNRLKQAHDMMARMSSGRVECRLAAVLQVLSDSYGIRTAEGTLVDVPLTRQDLSEMAGTTVESAIRAMSRWQKNGVLRTDRKLVTILDSRALSECL